MGTERKSNPIPLSDMDENFSIPCIKCEEFVPIKEIQKHRELHRVLKIFKCNIGNMPKNMKQLLRKRRQIINDAVAKLNSENPLPAKILQRIDWAFEILKNEINLKEKEEQANSTLSWLHKPSMRVSGFSEKLEHTALALGICQEQNSYWRMENEDRFFYKEGIFNQRKYGFFGLFDGYSGSIAAEKCAEYFHIFFMESMDQDLILKSNEIRKEHGCEREKFVEQAIKKAFNKMDNFLLHGDKESSKNRWSGASATICYVENMTMYVANVGSVHALYVKGNGTTMNLVQDHMPQNKKEQKRIKEAQGSISCSYRLPLVNGLLSTTRGIGNHGDANLRSSVICKPSVKIVKIDQNDQFLILFTAGVWEVFNNDEVMFLLEDIMPDVSEVENLRKHFQHLAESATDEHSICNNHLTSVPCVENVGRPRSHSADNHEDELLVQSSFDNSSLSTDTDIQPVSKEENECLDNVNNGDESPNRKAQLYKEDKACFLARALVERLSHAALLAGSRENLTAMVVLLKGCPINLYLLPNLKRKSVVQREWLNS